MRWPWLVLLAAILILLAPGCPREPKHARSAPPVSLPRVGTIGDHPPAEDTTVIAADAEGVLTVDGREIALEALPEYLAPLADRKRHPAPCCPSDRYVVLRLDRTLPWGVAQWIVRACAHPDVRIYRIHFAVLPEDGGDEEGTLATYRPTAHGLALLDPHSIRGRARVISTGPGSTPSAFHERMTKDLTSWVTLGGYREPKSYELTCDRLVPVEFILRIVDAVHRGEWSGQVLFADAPAPTGENAIRDLVCEARTTEVTPTVVTDFHDEYEGPVPNTTTALPPAERVRGGFAGTGARLYIQTASGPPDPTRPRADDHRAVANAVYAGLRWLRFHQNPDGFWDCDGFENQCKLNRCGGAGSEHHDPGVTGLALLAFLGAGDSHRTGRTYDHVRAMRAGFRYLERIQTPEGCFGPGTSDRPGIDHGIAAYAMVVAYARTGSVLLKQSAQKAIDFIGASRDLDTAGPHETRPGDETTAAMLWMLSALETAKDSGMLTVPEGALERARAWLERVGAPGIGGVGPPARPRWDDSSGAMDMAGWYFGTVAMYDLGGEWRRSWNAALRAAILRRQRWDMDQRGSWNPVGRWGREGGRVASTALMTMCLEVPYRHGRAWR